MRNSILIVEDDALVRESLSEVLNGEGCEVDAAASVAESLQKLTERKFDLALVDLRLSSTSGIEVLKKCKADHMDTDVIMMTGFATVETAVEAMRMGATDYLTKPINDDEIRMLIRRIFDTRKLRSENEFLKHELQEKDAQFHDIVGSDPEMRRIYSVIRATINTDTTVLLKGESGTGKGLIARAIHESSPIRKEGPYVEVSCGAIPRDLLESELFGHVKGAFTNAIRDRMGRFELANGGTILLDEIDALTPYLQVKLLRVLQQKTFERVGDTKTFRTDVRIIAATNRDLQEEIKEGRFREDLFYRLNVITIEIPPLRDRKGDIPDLVAHFLKKISEKLSREIRGVSPEAMQFLIKYEWPGNVRELENSLERAAVLTQRDILDISDFSEHLVNKV
ncbi:MAG: sigma-54-dependent Fis family transcriptional regulator, partial [Candidatus Omnitrophica bacterium]|nr:sigma-54-dependent Fis family transcriptional regulator [Candidatus Omnitrophota bacterium]